MSSTFEEFQTLYKQFRKKRKPDVSDQDIAKAFDLLSTCSDSEVIDVVEADKIYENQLSVFFWMSSIPLAIAKPWLKQENSFRILLAFTSNPAAQHFMNQAFLQFACDNYPDALIKAIKHSPKWWSPEFFDHLKLMKTHSNKAILSTWYEIDFWVKKMIKYKNEEPKHLAVLREYSFEEIFVGAVAWLEKRKRSEQKGLGNRSWWVANEVTMVDMTGQLLLELHKEVHSTTPPISELMDSKHKDFQAYVQEQMPPINPVESAAEGVYTPTEEMPPHKERLRKSLKWKLDYQVDEYNRDLYAAGLTEFKIIEKERLGVDIVTNEKFKLYHHNDKKVRYLEYFTWNKGAEDEQLRKKWDGTKVDFDLRVLWGVDAVKVYWKYLSFPNEITWNDSTIYFDKLTEIIKVLSLSLMFPGRNILMQHGEPIALNQFSFPKKLTRYFKHQWIAQFGEKELVTFVTKYLKWDRGIVQHHLEFITWDFGKPATEAMIKAEESVMVQFPLLKFDGKYYWLSPFNRDRKWEIILHRRLVLEGVVRNHNSIADQVAEQLKEDFEKNDIKCLANQDYFRTKEKKEGDFDVIAYQNGTLILIEMKITHHTENVARVFSYKANRLEFKAVDQLNKAEQFVEDQYDVMKGVIGFAKIREQLGIDKSFKDLKIKKWVVTNTFDFDRQAMASDITKLSLLELKVILNNDLQHLQSISPYVFNSRISENPKFKLKEAVGVDVFERMMDQNALNAKFEPLDVSKEACDLWAEGAQCSVEDLVVAVREGKVWAFMDKLYTMETDLGYKFNS
jgi:hypothetical protein